MADEIIQKRTYELVEYIQLVPTEPGYENPGDIWIPVDKNSWPEAKKISLLQFIYNLHKEQKIINMTSVSYNEVYEIPFSISGYYIDVKAQRLVNGIIENIPIVKFVPDVYGFAIQLADYEAGDVVKYIAFE